MEKICETIKNNIYAFKFVLLLSIKRIVHKILVEMIFYIAWVFYSTYFIKIIVESIKYNRPYSEIVNFVLIIGAISIVNCLYTLYCENSIMPYEENESKKKFVEITCRKASHSSLVNYESPQYYDNYTVVLNDAWDKLSGAVNCQISIVLTIIASALFIVTMYTIDKAVLLFLIIPLIGNFVISPVFNELVFKRYRESVKSNRKITYVDRVMYFVRYSKDIKMTDIGRVLKKEYAKSVDELDEVAEKHKKSITLWGTIHYMFSYSFFFEGVLLYGAYKVLLTNDGMKIEDMAILTSAMVTASWVLSRLINAIIEYSKNSLYIYKFKEFMNTNERKSGTLAAPKKIEKIEFRNVSFTYDDKKVLDDISFSIYPHETVAIVGGNGAGKTTLIKLLLGLYRVQGGEILVNGVNIDKYQVEDYIEIFSVVFQDFSIYADTIRFNILLGREIPYEDEKLIEVLELLGLWDKIKKLPATLDSELTREFFDDGLVLSGGELQKLALARVLLGEGKICILDEPTSALDPISEKCVYDLLIKKNQSIKIFVSHKLTSARNADKILVLSKGKLVEQGNHDKLMRQDGVYKKLFDLQMENYFPQNG